MTTGHTYTKEYSSETKGKQNIKGTQNLYKNKKGRAMVIFYCQTVIPLIFSFGDILNF